MHEIGRSGLVHWDDPKEWDGEGGGIGFRMGNTYTPVLNESQAGIKLARRNIDALIYADDFTLFKKN